MDTATVLQIIKMIDAYFSSAYEKITTAHEKGEDASAYDIGVCDQMSSLSDELQDIIEARVNALESQTGE